MEWRELTGGLNTYDEEYAVAQNQCVDVTDVSFARQGTIESRGGYTRANRAAMAGAIAGMFEYYTDSGTAIRVAKIGTQFYAMSISSGDVITVGASLSGAVGNAKYCSFVGFANKVCIFDAAGNYVYDGTNWTKMGRAAPTGITAADGGASGNLDDGGAYLWKFSFYSTSLDLESELSAALSLTLTAGQTKAAITFPAGVTGQIDTVWDKVKVYRTVGGGTEYFYHSQQTASFTDNTADGSLGVAAVDTSYTALGAMSFAVEFDGRMWGNVTAERTNMYYTDAGYPERWKLTQVLRVGQQDGDRLMGALKIHGRLVLLKEHSMWMLSGTDTSTYEFVQIEGGRGASSVRGNIVSQGVGYVFNIRDFIYRFRGNEVHPIGRRIRDHVQGLDTDSAYLYFHAGYEPVADSIWFSVRRSGESVNDRVLVYFTLTDAWSIYKIRVSAMATMHRGSDGDARLLFGDEDGYFSWAEEGESCGVPGGTTSGVVTTGSSTTVVKTLGTLNTTSDGLKAMDLTVIYADGTIETGKILSNTATDITLTAALSGGAPAAADEWYVGAVDFYWKGRLDDCGDPFYAKRVQVVRVAVSKPSSKNLRARLSYDGTAGTWQVQDVSTETVMEWSESKTARRYQLELRHIVNSGKMIVGGWQLPARDIEPSKGPVRR